MNKKINVITPHAQIIDEWYSVMAQNNCMIQPKAATILGTILAKWDISTKIETRDVWEESLTIKVSELSDWYKSLQPTEKMQYEKARLRASEENDARSRSSANMLLKG